MLKINIAISNWILLWTLSTVNGFDILKFINIDENRLVSNVLDMMKNTNLRSDPPPLNRVEVRGRHIKPTRKHQNGRELANKRLVKRVIPHGYEVNYMEYDNKFNALYKPLVRVHKRPSDKRNVGSKYDLVLVLDEDQFKDVISNLGQDESLLEPFAIENTNVKYLPKERDLKYYLNSDEKHKLDYLNPLRHKLEDETKQFKPKNIQNELQHDLTDNSFELFPENQMQSDSKGDELDEPKMYKHKLLELIDQVNEKQRKTKGNKKADDSQEQQNRFDTGNLVSKELKTDIERNNVEKPDMKPFDNSRQKNDDIYYLNLLEKLIQSKADDETRDEVDSLDSGSDKYGWFGPIGKPSSIQSNKLKENENTKPKYNQLSFDQIEQPNSKQQIKNRKHDISEEINVDTNDLIYLTITKDKKNLLNPIKKVVTREFPLMHDKKRMFGAVGQLHRKPEGKVKNNKNWHRLEGFKIAQINKKRGKFSPDLMKKSDIYSLLSNMAQLKANNMKREQKEETDSEYFRSEFSPELIKKSDKYSLLSEMAQLKANNLKRKKQEMDREYFRGEFSPDLIKKSDKYSLLSEMAQLKANNMKRKKQEMDREYFRGEFSPDSIKKSDIYSLLSEIAQLKANNIKRGKKGETDREYFRGEFTPDLIKKSDKYSLLSEIAQLKANNLKRRKQEIDREYLRFKSGEDEMDKIKNINGELLWSESQTTTKKPTWKSRYPYWNYWTYDKTIHQDACKGNAIKLGQVCIIRN